MSQKIVVRTCAAIMGLSGLVILFATLYPIAAYEWEAAKKFPSLISPLISESKNVSLDKFDTTNASNWFADSKEEDFSDNPVGSFMITIPKLEIESAKVAIGGKDLSKSLIQYPGTALPGKIGNTVIFGHSILPFFYDPKNYLAIFSKLDKLEKGDRVYVTFDSVTYEYNIEKMFEVKPNDIDILEQDLTDSFLTLVTCTPPGDPRKPKRLIVRARLVPPK